MLSWAVGIGLVLDLGMTLSGRRKQRSKLRGCEDMSVYLVRQRAVALSILEPILEDAFLGSPCSSKLFPSQLPLNEFSPSDPPQRAYFNSAKN